MNVTFKIFRYNLEKDNEPRYQNYKLNVEKGFTVLDCLNEIKWHQDGTLTFRKSCRSSICGSCAIRVNGHAKLACKTQVMNEIYNGNEVLIEPLMNHNVIKDLVVDQELFWEQLKTVMPWLIPKNENLGKTKENLVPKGDSSKFKNSETCILCGCCHSDCNSVAFEKNFLGPAALVKGYRFVIDPRDSKCRERLERYTKKGLWHCAHTYHCIEQCPKKIRPGDLISYLREFAIQEGITNNSGARNAIYMRDSLKYFGKLYEFFYIPCVKGPVGFIRDMPLAIKMALKGRIPPIFMKRIKGIENIRDIYKKINLEEE